MKKKYITDKNGTKMVRMPAEMMKDLRDPIDHPENYGKKPPKKMVKWIEEQTASGYVYPEALKLWKDSQPKVYTYTEDEFKDYYLENQDEIEMVLDRTESLKNPENDEGDGMAELWLIKWMMIQDREGIKIDIEAYDEGKVLINLVPFRNLRLS